jgi:hypothetical protein
VSTANEFIIYHPKITRIRLVKRKQRGMQTPDHTSAAPECSREGKQEVLFLKKRTKKTFASWGRLDRECR